MEDVKLLKYTIRGLNYRYNALKKINAVLSEAEDIKGFLDNVLGMVMDVFGAEAGIILRPIDNEYMKAKAFRAEIPFEKEVKSREEIENIKILIKGSGVYELLSGNKDIEINDNPETSIEYRSIIKQALGGITNKISVPIKIKKSVLGIIELYNILGGFGNDKQETLISIGGQVAISMEFFERFTKLQERTIALRDLTSITEAISSPHQMKMVLDVILKNTYKFFEADGCSIIIKDETGNPEFAGVIGDKAQNLKGHKLNKGEGIVGMVMEKEEPFLIEEIKNEERFSPNVDEITQMTTGSIICAPLSVINKVIGVIEVVRTVDKLPFTEEDLGMLVILASHASIALDKARLFTQKDEWFKSTVELLCNIIGIKDGLFPEHRKMVRKFVLLIGLQLNLNSEEIENLVLASSIQDIGKLIIPEKILEKETKLTVEEWDEIRKHPLISVEILGTIDEFIEIVPIIKYHHEKYDGTGYPEGLKGEEIPKLARILSIADSYAAMIDRRPYRNSLTREEAKKAIIEQKGKQFDPKLVDEFIKVLEREGE